MSDRLYRSPDDKVLAGVAGGMAELWDLDPSLVRVGWLILTPLTAGFAVIVYIVMAIVVPEDSRATKPGAPSSGHGAYGSGATGWGTAGPSAAPDAPAGSAPAGPADATPAAAAAGAGAAGAFTTGPAASSSPAPAGPGADETPVAGPTGPWPASGGSTTGGPIGSPVVGPAPGSAAWSDTRRANRERRHAERSAERAARRAARGSNPGSGAIVGGLILIVLGGAFLASELIPNFDWHTAWPIGLIVIGGLLVLGSVRRTPKQPSPKQP